MQSSTRKAGRSVFFTQVVSYLLIILVVTVTYSPLDASVRALRALVF